MKKFSLSRITFLHLLPGFCLILGILILNYLIPTTMMPRYLVFIISSIFILVPVELGIIKYYKKNEGSSKFIDLHEEKEKQNCKQTVVFSIISIFWAVFIFAAFGTLVNNYIKEIFFSWFPNVMEMGGFVKISQFYSRAMLITTYFLGLLTIGIIIPIVEELYFRGFLLPRMKNGKFTASFIGTVLFAIYHFWSPWMIPIRILAIFPMTYFVLQKRNIYIGIITHIFLNIMGDFILLIPVIFN